MRGLDTRVHILLPKEFLKELDEQAQVSLLNRSDFIRQALMEKMARKSLIKDHSSILPALDEMEPAEFSL